VVQHEGSTFYVKEKKKNTIGRAVSTLGGKEGEGKKKGEWERVREGTKESRMGPKPVETKTKSRRKEMTRPQKSFRKSCNLMGILPVGETNKKSGGGGGGRARCKKGSKPVEVVV